MRRLGSIAVALMLALASATMASQPDVGEWADPIRAGLAAYADAAPPLDRVENLEISLPSDAVMTLRWSASAERFVEVLKMIEARAEPSGDGYDHTTGLNRFAQHLPGGAYVAVEHWADHFGLYRLVMVTSVSPWIADEWLTAFETYRRAGGFGGTPLLTPPLPAP
ncbi:hypothetical protein [Devosia faecipullorum]|uniref:hypothetical protein n=1 Tax=Devosia faecipullorum TaxID=2755039 RepID=UPI00187BA0F4|nr:hypothetical protein [Devosia faecipullorum]MBE7731794.1 hypothetical protein [Devosia faecipullorum]